MHWPFWHVLAPVPQPTPLVLGWQPSSGLVHSMQGPEQVVHCTGGADVG